MFVKDEKGLKIEQEESVKFENHNELNELEYIHKKSDRKTLHKIKIITFWAFAALSGIYAVIYFWHSIAPDCWRWLTAEEVSDMKATAIAICAGVFTSLCNSYFLGKK